MAQSATTNQNASAETSNNSATNRPVIGAETNKEAGITDGQKFLKTHDDPDLLKTND
ncbi:MAG: hypothetical protein LBP75_02770 [Planctomycetota bacterium]|nr:hypothetical protein [Planctomycetota bacterium]